MEKFLPGELIIKDNLEMDFIKIVGKLMKLSLYLNELKIFLHVGIKIWQLHKMVMYSYGLVLKMVERFLFLSKYSLTLLKLEFNLFLVVINLQSLLHLRD